VISPASDPGFAAHPVHGWWAQQDEIAQVVGFCERTRCAVDVGAHIGVWSRALVERGFDCICAFEPCVENRLCCEENVAGLGRVNLFPEALGDEEGGCSLVLPVGGNSGMRYVWAVGGIPMQRLDDYRFDNVDLIKVDVEGYEGKVLNGALDTIWRCSPVIVFEDNGNGQKYYGASWIDPKKVLKGMGYKRRLRIRRDEVWLPE